jgi:hypothetical protein
MLDLSGYRVLPFASVYQDYQVSTLKFVILEKQIKGMVNNGDLWTLSMEAGIRKKDPLIIMLFMS